MYEHLLGATVELRTSNLGPVIGQISDCDHGGVRVLFDRTVRGYFAEWVDVADLEPVAPFAYRVG